MARKAFVHRYRWSHKKRREQLRRELKAGTVTLIAATKEGWLYEIPEDFRLAPTR